MKLYEKWLIQAYTRDGNSIPAYWNVYMPIEQKIYEDILENKIETMEGKLSELADKYKMKPEQFAGFVDGINESLINEIDVMGLTEDSNVKLEIQFEELYKKMVEYKAQHLINLPQWDNVIPEEKRKSLYKEQKISRTVTKEAKIGRNEPCPCGSGKKYKKCCGAN